MALINLLVDPTRRDLRQFGCIWLPLFCALVGYLTWRPESSLKFAAWIWGAGALSLILGLLWPTALRPMFVALIYVTAPIGFVVSHAVLLLVYYGVITPVGLLLRLFGRSPIDRSFDPAASTYWRPCNRDRSTESYFRQF